MIINAGNPSLQNIITRTLMGKKEKRQSFEEVFDKLNKNFAMMNTRMSLNSVLTNEQMYHCYVQHTILKLQQSNDTFGESELITVLMRLLRNDPSGNALTGPLVTATATPTTGTSLGTLPLGTAIPTPAPLTAPPPVPLITSPLVTAPLVTAPLVTSPSPLLSTTPSKPTGTPLSAIIIPPGWSLQSGAPFPVLQLFTGIGPGLGQQAQVFKI